MIVDLQRCAQSVRTEIRGRIFTVQIQHEASDGRGGITAVRNQFVKRFVRFADGVLTEGFEQIARMDVR